MNSAWFFCSHLPRADCFCNAEPACKGQNELLPNIPLSLTVTKTQSYMLWRKKQIHEAGRPENRNQPCTKRWAAGTWTKLMRPIYKLLWLLLVGRQDQPHNFPEDLDFWSLQAWGKWRHQKADDLGERQPEGNAKGPGSGLKRPHVSWSSFFLCSFVLMRFMPSWGLPHL